MAKRATASKIDKQSIESLIALYELEPGLRDIFVEGDTDRRFIEWVFLRLGISHARVTEIQNIEVPIALFDGEGDNGNRGRTIELANRLAASNAAAKCVRCVVDNDFDIVDGIRQPAGLIVATDFACLEAFFLDEMHLTKFLKLYYRIDVSADLKRSIFDVAETIFCARLAKRDSYRTWSWVDPKRSYAFAAGRVLIKLADFIKRLVVENGSSDVKGFEALVEQARSRLTGDPRNQTNGHDLVSILCLVGRGHGAAPSVFHVEAVSRAWILGGEWEIVKNFRLVQTLAAWLATSSR